jgi:RNA polymerase sigma-70 factor, ECF subfamily
MTITTEYVWESFHDPLQQFIRKHVRDASTAEDILQDVFVNIHTHLATLKDQDKLHHWLYQIARHAIIDHARRHKVTETLPDTFDPPEEPAQDDVEQAFLPSVTAMLACLPAAYREALLLTEYQGLTQKALAERLGLSLSGAKSRVQRAREKLKALLLACCHFEFDRRGKIIDYQPHCACCANGCQSDDCT